jgi:prepilin-type N-terminal cleavage/methylation domain-containing protein
VPNFFTMVRKLRQRADDDHGFTLIELLVSMLIFSFVITAAYAALFMVQTQTKDTLARADAIQQAKLAVAQMDRQIRSGNVLYDPAQEATLGFPMSMRIYTQANGVEKCVQWQIVSGKLRMRSWSPNWQTDNIVTSWTTIARGVVNQSSVSSDTPFSLAAVAAGGGAYSARVVNVLLRMKNSGSKGKAYDVTTSLAGRNTVYGYDTSTCSPIPA